MVRENQVIRAGVCCLLLSLNMSPLIIQTPAHRALRMSNKYDALVEQQSECKENPHIYHAYREVQAYKGLIDGMIMYICKNIHKKIPIEDMQDYLNRSINGNNIFKDLNKNEKDKIIKLAHVITCQANSVSSHPQAEPDLRVVEKGEAIAAAEAERDQAKKTVSEEEIVRIREQALSMSDEYHALVTQQKGCKQYPRIYNDYREVQAYKGLVDGMIMYICANIPNERSTEYDKDLLNNILINENNIFKNLTEDKKDKKDKIIKLAHVITSMAKHRFRKS